MSKGVYVDASGFGDAFEGILDEFFAQTDIECRQAVQAGGKVAKETLQGTNDPRKTGEYAEGWAYRAELKGFGGYYVRVYNKTKPSLTHLLEFGHGGPSPAPAHVHIEPAYEAGAEEILRRLRDG